MFVGILFALFLSASVLASSSYTARVLFQIGGKPGDGVTRGLAGNGVSDISDSRVRTLNNLGEVLYAFGDHRPGLWLPKPHYGRPAGLNDLTSFSSLPNRGAMAFTDQGVFYHFTADPSRPNDPLETLIYVYRGTVGGESIQASAYRFDELPSLDNGDHLRRQSYFVEGVTQTGQLTGKSYVEVRLKDLPDNPFYWDKAPGEPESLFFDVTSILLPGQAGVPLCDKLPQLTYGFRSQSPGGTAVIIRSDLCGLSLVYTLAVGSQGGERVVARSGGVGPPEVDPVSSLVAVNDRGDVAGLDQQGIWVSSADGTVRRLSFTDVQDIRFNQAGQLFFERNQDLHLWADDGTVTPLGLSWTDFGYQPDFELRDINERGQMVVSAVSTSNGKRYALLVSPTLSVRLTVSTNKADTGETITVNAALASLTDSPLTAVTPVSPLQWKGTGEWKTISGPIPGSPLTLAPGGQTNLVWQLQGLKSGQGYFSLSMQATVGTDLVKTIPAFSERVRLLDRSVGDLLIKRDVEPADQFGLDGVYQSVPTDAQLRTNVVARNEISKFEVALQNDGRLPVTFLLAGIESESAGWNVKYDWQGQDVSSQIRAAGGFQFPELAPGESSMVTVQMTPSSAAIGSTTQTTLSLSSTNKPGEILDVVGAVSQLAAVPVDLTFHRGLGSAFTTASLTAGQDNINAPLEFVADLNVLEAQPLIGEGLQQPANYYGMVADGVTPLLVRIHADPKDLALSPQGRTFRSSVTLGTGGIFSGPALILLC